MSLAWNYISRKNVARNLIKFPCNLFVEHLTLSDKVVFSFDQLENTVRVRRWAVSDYFTSVLPPLKEFTTNNIFSDPRIEFKQYWNFFKNPSGGPCISNTEPRTLYEYFFNTFLDNFGSYNLYKECWLWQIFIDKFGGEYKLNRIRKGLGYLGIRDIAIDVMFKEQMNVEVKAPNIWAIWELWMKYMLDCENIPGEFIFSSVS